MKTNKAYDKSAWESRQDELRFPKSVTFFCRVDGKAINHAVFLETKIAQNENEEEDCSEWLHSICKRNDRKPLYSNVEGIIQKAM